MGFGGIITREYDSSPVTSPITEKDDIFRCISSVPCKREEYMMLCVGSNHDLDKIDIKDGTLVVNSNSGEVFVGRNKKWEPIFEVKNSEYKHHGEGELKPMICTQCGGKIRNRICTCCGTEFYFS